MGRHTLISATELRAWRTQNDRTLHLHAKGRVPAGTKDIRFRRDLIKPGTFHLEAWVTGIPYEVPYDHKQTFKSFIPVDNVHIYTANGIVVIPVVEVSRFDGQTGKEVQAMSGGSKDTLKGTVATPATRSAPTEQISLDHDINAILGFPFDIKQAVQLSRGGEIDIDYESSSLVLEKAGIKDVDMYWRFNPIQTGHTQVKVTVWGGQLPYILEVVYNIFVVSLNSAPIVEASEFKDPLDNWIPEYTWLFRVWTATHIVCEKYPGAKLYGVHATAPDHSAVDSTFGLSRMVCNFFLPDDGNKQVFIMSTGINDWNKPLLIHTPVFDAEELPMPKDLTGENAVRELRNRGVDGKFTRLAMAWSRFIHKGGRQKVYIFTMEDGCQHEITYNDVEDPKDNTPAPIKTAEQAQPAQPAINASAVVPSQQSIGAAVQQLAQPAFNPLMIPQPPPLVGVAA